MEGDVAVGGLAALSCRERKCRNRGLIYSQLSHTILILSYQFLFLPRPPPSTGDSAAINSGKLTGRVLLGGQERKLEKFRQISAHVKQVRRRWEASNNKHREGAVVLGSVEACWFWPDQWHL